MLTCSLKLTGPLPCSLLISQLSIGSDYADMCRVAPELALLASLEDFTAKRMLVNSRVFATEIDGVEVCAVSVCCERRAFSLTRYACTHMHVHY